MKKNIIAIIITVAILIAFLGGFLLGRGNKKEPETIATTNNSTEGNVPDQTDPLTEGETEEGNVDQVDESMIPMLPEISFPEPDLDDQNDDGSLTIVFFGDSQFENGGENKTDIPHLVHDYIHARILNLGSGGTCAALTRNDSDDLEHWDNLSFYGMTLMLQGKASREVLEGKHQLTVMEAINPTEVDYYVISYGVNDFLNGIRPHIGGQESIPHNYYGALNMGIHNLKSISPQAQFIVCTPTYTQFFNQAGAYIGDSHIHDYGIGVFDEYANQAISLARGRYLLLDAAFDTMMDLNGINADQYLMDGIHLTEDGRRAYALTLSYIIAKDQGWTTREQTKVDIDHLDWAMEFLEDVPAPN